MIADAIQLAKPKKLTLNIPDFRATNLLDVDFAELKKLGIKHILLDVDLTLRKKFSFTLDTAFAAHLIHAKKSYGFASISLVTNNMTNLRRYTEPLGAQAFQPFWHNYWLVRKPSARFYARVLKTLHAKPTECVMIGDKLHSDVYGGNVSGIYTILLRPKGKDYWYDRILLTRRRERRTLQKARSFLSGKNTGR